MMVDDNENDDFFYIYVEASVDFAGPGLFTAAHNEWHSQSD